MKTKCSYYILFLCSFIILSALRLNAENSILKETFIYSIKGTDTLYLDKYDIVQEETRPCVIFVFGGGFFSGTRDADFYVPYYHFLVNEGFSVVAIDYRLNLKNFKAESKLKTKDFLNIFKQTIFMAVEDLYDATKYTLENAATWNIDKNTIVISGSSAGGITVLQAEYEHCNRTEIAQGLPSDFKYAGVISFAGAVFNNQGHLKWKETPAPVQLFHGNADKNVPFGKIKIFKWGFFGSEYIAQKYDKHKLPYYLFVEENADHRLANDPMIYNQEEIKIFLDKYVLQKQTLVTNINVKALNKPNVKKKFKIKDYIKANFGG